MRIKYKRTYKQTIKRNKYTQTLDLETKTTFKQFTRRNK